MNKQRNILADSIGDTTHFAAFDLMVKRRMDGVELDKILVYLIDSVDVSALPHLARQFDVLGYKGFRLATNESEQREIIKRAIELHRFKGTLWAVREALISIGFGDAEIVEHVPDHWAKFRINIDLGERPLNQFEIDELVKMVTEYKNVRSHLADLSYSISLGTDMTLMDSSDEGPADNTSDAINTGGDFKHNGLVYRDGSRNYSNDNDVLTIEILPV